MAAQYLLAFPVSQSVRKPVPKRKQEPALSNTMGTTQQHTNNTTTTNTVHPTYYNNILPASGT